MSRYIDADALEYDTEWSEYHDGFTAYSQMAIDTAPSIDLADYVPKDFHDKTCEAMAKRHQEEIANMVSVVRCKECNAYMTDGYADGCGFCAYHHSVVQADDYCSYGERSSE